MDDKLNPTPRETARGGIFSPFFGFIGRLIPAGMPPEVVLIALALLVWGISRLGSMLLSQLMMLFVDINQHILHAPFDLLDMNTYTVRSIVQGALSLAEVVFGIALWKRLPWARKGTIVLLVMVFLHSLWQDWVMFSPFGRPSFTAQQLFISLLHLVVYFLLYGMMSYLLCLPRTRATFGEHDLGNELAADMPTGPGAGTPPDIDRVLIDEPPVADRWRNDIIGFISTPFIRILRTGITPVIALIALSLLEDGMMSLIPAFIGLFSHIEGLTFPNSLFFALQHVVMLAVGLFSILVVVGLLRLRPWARYWAVLLFTIFAIFAVLSVMVAPIMIALQAREGSSLNPPAAMLVSFAEQIISTFLNFFFLAVMAYYLTRPEAIRLYDQRKPVG